MTLNVWLYSLISVAIVSIISLVGALTLALNSQKIKSLLLYLISFSAGALLGDAFLHILPELSARGLGAKEGGYLILGILIFFGLERFAWWHHSHAEHKEEVHAVVYLTQIGDTLHNFIDGVIIAASYFISLPVGIATTLAVVFHEIPQELGNFAVLVHGGWSARKALFYNFLSALSSVLGALLVLVFVRRVAEVPGWLIAIAASSFIYIAMTDLIPEIHREENHQKSAGLLLSLLLGVVVMGLLLFLE